MLDSNAMFARRGSHLVDLIAVMIRLKNAETLESYGSSIMNTTEDVSKRATTIRITTGCVFDALNKESRWQSTAVFCEPDGKADETSPEATMVVI
jgi:hypothetical protein